MKYCLETTTPKTSPSQRELSTHPGRFSTRPLAVRILPQDSSLVRSIRVGTPKLITHTHIFMIWEVISQLHRTSVTQGVLAGIILCNWAPSPGTFCESANYTLIVRELIFQLPTHFFKTFSRLFGTLGPVAWEPFFRPFWDFGPGGPERLL